MVLVATALTLLSVATAFNAIPPQPQMPMTPIRSWSTEGCRPRKSTAAMKSSVLMSGEATLRGSPPLSPVKDGSKARVAKPRSAMVWA
ncbi:hypothetical protein D3C87_1581810 [compost metagenome]